MLPTPSRALSLSNPLSPSHSLQALGWLCKLAGSADAAAAVVVAAAAGVLAALGAAVVVVW